MLVTRLTVRRDERFHWTCAHGAAAIRRDGMTVKPHMGVSWWTNMDKPDRHTRAACVLTSNSLDCDRMQYRCRAASTLLLMPWNAFKVGLDPDYIEMLEGPFGAKPDRWWVATERVIVNSVRRAA